MGVTFDSADGTLSLDTRGFSIIGASFLGGSMILGLAAGVSSEYGGPAMLSSIASLDSALLDSPALALGFVIGVGCLPRFACKVLAFLGGTAWGDSGTLASFDGLQQFRTDRNLEKPFFLGLSALLADSFSMIFSWVDVAGATKFSFLESLLLAVLPFLLDAFMLPLDPRFEDFSWPVE